MHYGPEQLDFPAFIIHVPMCLGVSKRVSKRMSAAGRMSEASGVEQANDRTDEPVAQYLCLDYFLFCTIVP